MLSAVRSVVADPNGMVGEMEDNDMFVLSVVAHLSERKHNPLVFLTFILSTHSSWVKRTEARSLKRDLCVGKQSLAYSKYSLTHHSLQKSSTKYFL